MKTLCILVGAALLLPVESRCDTGADPASDASAPPSATPFELPPVPESVAPSSPDARTFLVRQFVFEGNTAIPEQALQSIAASYRNRPLRLLDVEALRQAITQFYIERGYVNSGAVIPRDGYADGVLRVSIVEGKIAQTRIRGQDRLREDYVVSRLIRPGEPLNMSVLEERLRLLLTDPLFDRVNARLTPGAELGSAILDVDIVRARAWRLGLFANNYRAPAVGSTVAGIDGALSNLTSWGDVLALAAYRAGDANNYDLNWSLPLFAKATMLDVHLAHASSSVIEEPLRDLNIESIVETREIGITHPVIDRSRTRLVLGVGYSQRVNRTSLDGEPFSFVAGESSGRVKVEDWRFTQELVQRFDGHVLALRSALTWGSNNLDAQALIPGQAARHYRLWIGQAQTLSTLWDAKADLVLRATVQYAWDRLVPLEKLSVGGRFSVRGYRENTLVRDQGYYATAELQWPAVGDRRARRRLELVAPFLDFGRASDRGEPADSLASLGLGVRGQYEKLEGELFYGLRLMSAPVKTSGDLQDHGIHLQLRYNF
ncbi:MAG TPA: ShlB/FhaC/HecB family hemolysin secretion/activation protein [Burkholderiales bacterium]|nr:ShlB/FhaC/HecB family hemolysin secretion/activation protein [Burkholderiales bacterium]